MALENWVDKQDGIDDILAEDINSIANAVIETQEEINKIVTTDYEQLENLPEINGVELLGNKSLTDLGIDIPAKTSELENDSGFIDDTAFENYYTKTEVDNAISGIETGGGHYETVVEEIWQRNKIFTPVSFDYENQVITVSDGDLDEYSIGDKIYCIIVPNISDCTLNSLSGRLNTNTLTVLSATELSASDALHADTLLQIFILKV